MQCSRLNGDTDCVLATFLVSVFSIILAGVSHAQVTPSASGSLGTNVTPGPTYEITGGTRPGGGTNLFHSFGQFSLLAGETALFKDAAPPSTTNIIGRVTGGQSNILGTIDTATYYPGANLFLINPAGIVFGATASLNVGGSAHFSTADYLRLNDPVGIFYADPAKPTVLTSTPVAAFGFVGPTFSSIDVQGSTLALGSTDQSLSLVGGSVTMTGGVLSAPGPNSHVNLVSVASSGEVSVSNYQLAPGMQGGAITLSAGATVDVSGDGAGTILIRGGQLVMDNSFLTAVTVGATDGAGTVVDVMLQGDLTLSNGSQIGATGFDVGRTGDIAVSMNNMNVRDGSSIATTGLGDGLAGDISVTGSGSISITGPNSSVQSTSLANGPTGMVTIVAPSLTVADRGAISTSAVGAGRSGDITLQVGDLNILSGGSIFSSGDAGSGLITLNASGTASITGRFDVFTPSQVSNSSGGVAGTGDIRITARDVMVADGARVNSEATGQPGGSIVITATDSATIAGGGRMRMAVDAGPGGLINISAPTVILNQGILQTQTVGSGDAGAISIRATNLSLSNGSLVDSSAGLGSTALGGNITVNANQVGLSSGSSFSARSLGTGDAGDISIKANQVNLFDSSITTQASAVNGGNITIMAGELVRLNNSQINASVAGGPGTTGGNILIDPPFVVLQNNSHILTQAIAGNGGNISIVAGSLFVDPTSNISALSQGGVSGTVNVQSPVTFLSGTFSQLPKKPVQAASLLQARCAARYQGSEDSSFVQRGRDGLPPEPGGWLASPMLAVAGLMELQIGRNVPVSIEETATAQSDGETTPLLLADARVGPLVGTMPADGSTDCGL